MTNRTKGTILKASAITLDVGGPLAATLSQFPIWVDRSSSATVSGLFLILAFLSALPFWRQIKAWIKSPSVPVLWLVLTIFFVALRNIVDEMLIVCVVGAISNCIGAGVYKCGTIVTAKDESRGDV